MLSFVCSVWRFVVYRIHVCLWLGGWAVQLIAAAGPLRIIRWVWLMMRIFWFSFLLLYQVFLPNVWYYCTSGHILHGVPYSDVDVTKGRSVLDIYLPSPAYAWIAGMQRRKKKYPVVIFFVGGAWIVGYKAWGALLSRLLSTAGIICFTPDYRNFPQATMSDMLQDYEDAIEWIVDHVAVYGGDPENITIIGQSAGAQLTLTTLLEAYRHLSKPGGEPATRSAAKRRVKLSQKLLSMKAFVGVSGPYNLPGLIPHFERQGLYSDVTDVIFEAHGMLRAASRRKAARARPRQSSLLSSFCSVPSSADSAGDGSLDGHGDGDSDSEPGRGAGGDSDDGEEDAAFLSTSETERLGGVRGYSPSHIVDDIAVRAALSPSSRAGGGAVRSSNNGCAAAAAADPRLPPVFLVHGSQDQSVPCSESQRLSEKLRSHGFLSAFKILEGWSHTAPIIEGPFNDREGLSGPEHPNLLKDILTIVMAKDVVDLAEGAGVAHEERSEQGTEKVVMPMSKRGFVGNIALVDSWVDPKTLATALAASPHVGPSLLRLAAVINPF
eukprot:Rhum_TRINITY_DN19205_c0_g1::Rhum_TRINITY_DN19205_c0_g1_i1::g.169532::m.169532